MRSSRIHSIAALLVALGLTACGGKASFDVSGVVTGLNSLPASSVTLANGSDQITLNGDVTGPSAPFIFPNRIDYGTAYNVVVQTQPAHMTCVPTSATGSAGHTATIAATVSCGVNTFVLSGTVTGLTGTGLELANGSLPATVLPLPLTPTAAVAFAFAPVAFGQTYTVRVLTPPSNPMQVCTVQAASGTTVGAPTGTMGDGAVANILVTCVTPG